MREETVTFFSEGAQLSGTFRLPDEVGDGPRPAIVQGPGWLGLRDARLYLRYHEALTVAGFAVFIFDYRGFGDSEGSAEFLDPAGQVQDLVNAVTYLETREDIDSDNVGVFGSGGTGGGNAIVLAARDDRVRCVVSQVPVADGGDWLHRMRPEHEWHSFKERLAENRRQRVLTGRGALVHPREEIMVPTPERRATTVKEDVDARIPTKVDLASADAILAYKPIELVDRIAPRPLLVIGVDNDAVTPTDHAVALYDRAGSPKQLILQRHTTHYAAYDQYGDEVIPTIVEWFTAHLSRGNLDIRSEPKAGQ